MDDPAAGPPTNLATSLSRREALEAYTPPALAVISLANPQTLGHSAVRRHTSRRSGDSNGGLGVANPGHDPKRNCGGNAEDGRGNADDGPTDYGNNGDGGKGGGKKK